MKKEYDLKKMKVKHRGPVIDPKTAKVMISLRLDGDILNWLVKNADQSRIPYQTTINAILKAAMDHSEKKGNEDIRALIQEEIALDRKRTG